MIVKEFEDFLIQTRAQLLADFQNPADVQELDVYFKTLLDYQELVTKAMFRKLQEIQEDIIKAKGDIEKDTRERFALLMEVVKKK